MLLQALRKGADKHKAELEKLGLPVPSKSWQAMVIDFTNLIQGVFGAVAGSAWSTALFYFQPTMSEAPYGAVLWINLAIITGVTSLACLWLVVSSSTEGVEKPEKMSEEEKQRWEDEQATSREVQERAFINGSFSFLVLGGWVAVVNNIFAYFAIANEAGE